MRKWDDIRFFSNKGRVVQKRAHRLRVGTGKRSIKKNLRKLYKKALPIRGGGGGGGEPTWGSVSKEVKRENAEKSCPQQGVFLCVEKSSDGKGTNFNITPTPCRTTAKKGKWNSRKQKKGEKNAFDQEKDQKKRGGVFLRKKKLGAKKKGRIPRKGSFSKGLKRKSFKAELRIRDKEDTHFIPDKRGGTEPAGEKKKKKKYHLTGGKGGDSQEENN